MEDGSVINSEFTRSFAKFRSRLSPDVVITVIDASAAFAFFIRSEFVTCQWLEEEINCCRHLNEDIQWSLCPAGVYSEGRAVVGVGVPRFGGDGIDGEPGSCRRVEPSRANVVQTEVGFLPVAQTAEEDERVLSRRAGEYVSPGVYRKAALQVESGGVALDSASMQECNLFLN